MEDESMKINVVVLLMVAFALAVTPSAVAAEIIYLEANFDDKPLDMPIGTGGAEAAEPVDVSHKVIATVRGTPMPTPCLEVQDNAEIGAGSASFEFLAGAEITTGVVAITCSFWFHEPGPGCNAFLSVREQGGLSGGEIFTDLIFVADGSVEHYDENSVSGVIGAFEAGSVCPVALVFDMEAGTYDVWLDGELVLDDEDHGVTARGIGRVGFGCTHDPDLEGSFSVDDVRVTDTFPTPVTPATWGRLKRLPIADLGAP
jgi:hypothetical protein